MLIAHEPSCKASTFKLLQRSTYSFLRFFDSPFIRPVINYQSSNKKGTRGLVLLQIGLLVYLIVLLKPRRVNEEPVDIVYTWVNGSDPEFVESLVKHRRSLLRTGADLCAGHLDQCFVSNYVITPQARFELILFKNEKKYKSFKILFSKQLGDVRVVSVTPISEDDLSFSVVEMETIEAAEEMLESNLHSIPVFDDFFGLVPSVC